MEVRFLKAGNGDCIIIQGNEHCIVIDSGDTCYELREFINNCIASGKKIDLLVITHYDSDHIKGLCDILSEISFEEMKTLIKCVWFNATKVGYKGNEKALSANDAIKLGNMLIQADVPWVSELKSGMNKEICEECQLEIIEGGSIYDMPDKGDLLSNVKSDWNTSFKELERYLDDDAQDCSVTNAQSIIIVAHINGKNILFPGDATPQKLSEALDRYRKDSIAKFELIKLPHHGSYKNMTQDILEKIECSDYVISTNGLQFYHPNKKMMLKVIKWGRFVDGKKLTFHMNYYEELFEKLNITESDKLNYSFECDGQRTFEF